MTEAAQHRAEYERRLHRVLRYIDEHLDQPLSLEELAKVAHFSPFHFHRIFSAAAGETLGNYLTRRRVETAAARLASQPGLSVLSLALSVGFQSGEAFSRAFKRHFGLAPSAWKQAGGRSSAKRKIGQGVRNHDQAGSEAFGYAPDMASSTHSSLQVTICTRSDVRIAYLRYQGPFGELLGSFWCDQVAPWMATHNLFGATRYGISHDDPAITAQGLCRYDAAVEVDATFVPTGPAQVTTLPGGRYACARFKGQSADLPAAWQQLLREWVPSSGYQLDARPCFEAYAPSDAMDETTGAFTCSLCIPITPL